MDTYVSILLMVVSVSPFAHQQLRYPDDDVLLYIHTLYSSLNSDMKSRYALSGRFTAVPLSSLILSFARFSNTHTHTHTTTISTHVYIHTQHQ